MPERVNYLGGRKTRDRVREERRQELFLRKERLKPLMGFRGKQGSLCSLRVL